MMRYWQCMECESKAHHKGLCRSCTTYDEGGNIVKPMPRERVDSKGNKYVSPQKIHENIDLGMTKRKFIDRRRRKLTKKQQALAKEEAKALMAAQKELEAANEGNIVEFGEAVEEE